MQVSHVMVNFSKQYDPKPIRAEIKSIDFSKYGFNVEQVKNADFLEGIDTVTLKITPISGESFNSATLLADLDKLFNDYAILNPRIENVVTVKNQVENNN